MKCREKSEQRPVEKAAVVHSHCSEKSQSKGGQNQMKRSKAMEKMQLKQRKERLEMPILKEYIYFFFIYI